ncbi:aminoglycoside phosphotransferase family protein [Streptomyces kaniharaensis]|uniref:Aminoglycoside phosphotransferase family protein n=1 Tax=Streptomyces kaniharaensis TaxID=212423 RepID=A0A6N7KPB1_9ACTN|nr:aminoglycoside phosphotransferase family protein [Streptomyces kaniharaensis]MQS13366.1 aminoglycoside phosphotransferase family protein [Streptomyces kaniharaensis]
MAATDAVVSRPHPLLVNALAAAGFDAAGARFTPLKAGTDSLPFAVTTHAGDNLVVKVRRAGSRSRYPTAAWASARMREAGIPAAEILWHSREACVETRCPGRPLEAEPPTPQDLDAAARAGEMLRRLHSIQVGSFGQLDGHGIGQHATIQGWFLSLAARSVPSLDGLDLPGLLNRTRFILDVGSPRLAEGRPRLLHGDWVGRHLFTNGRQITGIVDLESVRGGDPLAELAGWSLREPAPMTAALLDGYFDGPLPADHLLPLVLFRLRIAYSLLQFHASCDDQDMVRLRAAQLQADLDDLDHGHLSAIPRITPDADSSARRRP